jgi:nuclear GTP-binding protein
VRLRHKIEKASAAKQRRQRKLAKNNPEWRTRLKKDPGIPNLYPFKEKLLQEIAEKKAQKEEEALRRREDARALKKAETTGNIQSAGDAMEEDILIDDDGNSIDEEMDVGFDATAEVFRLTIEGR